MATPSANYIPSFIQAAMSGSRPITLTFSQVLDTNIASTSSFIYDAADAPLKSTQQLNVDWSSFQNHTFFMSAEAKVNIAFDQIINGFPFDGTRQETEIFFEKLTGFDRWVFDQFPTWQGELLFTGTAINEVTSSGTFISIADAAGALFPDISKKKTGATILNPNGKSLSIEMQLFVPSSSISTDKQIICQKVSGSTQGFTLFLSTSLSTSPTVNCTFAVCSGSTGMSVSALLNKGAFNHLCVTLNREMAVNYLEFFNNSVSVAKSVSQFSIGNMDIDASPFLIGSGTSITIGSTVVTPIQTLSGVMDEFRVFHSARSISQQQSFAPKSIFTTPDLKLYFKFNEPPPPLTTNITDAVNGIVIDSSGNALHAIISNFTGTLRLNAAADPQSPMIYEKAETLPVLFPAYPSIAALNLNLLSSASTYDQANPNLITRLVPQHYLLEGAQQDGFAEPEGTLNNPYGGSGIPGQGQAGSAQLFLSLLYVWARFFDEMKLYIDSFSTLRTVDYNSFNTVPNNFVLSLIKQYGFHLPPLFNDATMEQYLRAENIDQQIGSSANSLKFVQHQLLRRVLINLPDVLRSKGTQHSIKAFLRAVGIDPENSVRIREYGGPTTRQLSFSRETKREPGSMTQFISSSLATSPFLSASRIEPGVPLPAGTILYDGNGRSVGTTNPSDGMFTSGSWTWEGIVKYTPANIATMTNTTQSLVRLCVQTGSTIGLNGTGTGLLANLIAVSSSIEPKLILYVRAGNLSTSPTLMMTSDTVNPGIFNGDRWNVSFGCQRNDEIGSRVSSSYFMRMANQNNGTIQTYFSTSSYFYEAPTGVNAFRTINSVPYASGVFMAVGGGQTISSTGSFLNDASVNIGEARVTNFEGLLSNVRFWSRALSDVEWKEHVRNYKSLGVHDPLTNWNFGSAMSGSFGKVRMDTMTKQDVRRAQGTASLGPVGSISFLDFSLNGMHLTGTNFAVQQDTVVGELFDHSYLSPYYDEASTNEKVRIRSYQNQDLVNATPWAAVAPVYEIVKSEQPTDDVRFIVEFSLIDALNRDIVTMFATFDALDNALGAPELMFSPDYPDLTNMREIYFNRIQQKLNFKAFFEFFRWFDTTIGNFIQQLVPRKTNFKGTNFVIESHMLERHKLEYFSSEIYLSDADRSRTNDVLSLQQIAGAVRKY